MTDTDTVIAGRDGAVATVRFNRPDKKNALTMAMYDAATAMLKAAGEDDGVNAVLIAGTDACFTAGNDIVDFMQNPPVTPDTPVSRFLAAVTTYEKPLVAAVEGAAVGVGTTMLLHCDLVVVARGAKLHLPFVNLGLVPEAASSLLLPKLAGHQRAAELLMLGEPFTAEDALGLGLANRVVADGQAYAQAMTLAQSLAATPPTALKLTKARMRSDPAATAAHMQAEGKHFSAQLVSPEAREAFSAFIEKRPPDFSKAS